jgi:NADPH-dependent 2,4-dienoyl-CoA reductase/sulfur reductase-like enzyme
MKTIVIAGSSIAGLSAARELRRGGFDGRLVTVDRDPHVPYRRPEVSKGLLSGAVPDEKAAMGWAEELRTERITGGVLEGLDLERRTVRGVGADGRPFAEQYDGLIVATGTMARPSPFPALGGVHSLRTFSDARNMRPDLADAQSVVIVGGGFIGLEVASVARKLGKEVTVVEPLQAPLVHILGPIFSAALQAKHENEGVRFVLGQTVSELEGDASGSIRRVHLSSGDSLDADVVLVAIGSVPAVGWLRDSGLDVERGLICDTTCSVAGTEGVVAAGDVALWHNPLYDRLMRVEHWTNAIEQGSYAAKRLLGTHDRAGFVSAPYFWSEQYGSRLQSIGSTMGHDEAVALDDDPENLFVAYLKDGGLLGVTGMAAGASIFQFRNLVLERAPLSEVAAHFASLRQPVTS